MTVRDWLAQRGADVSLIDCALSIELTPAANDHAVCAAIRIGVSFKPRAGLATVAMLEGKAYIGGSEANPTDPDPYLALEALVAGESPQVPAPESR